MCYAQECKQSYTRKKKRTLTASASSNLIFQVNHKMDCLIVDMGGRTCTCRKWDMCGIPCCHAVSCIFFSLV